MFDLPSDLPPQTSSIVIAQVSHTEKSDLRVDYTIGACQLIQNPPIPPTTAVNTMAPVLLVYGYLKNDEKVSAENLTAEIQNAASFKMLEEPKYGRLVLEEGIQAAEYIPSDKNYVGNDRAAIIVKFGRYNIKVLFYFKVMRTVSGGTDESSPYEDKVNCPNGIIWKNNEF